MKENIIVSKSFDFAVKIVKFSFQMQNEKKEFVISRQLLKSGTSIGANIEESQGAISKAEFIAKLQISLKEAKEAKYWLRLIHASDIYTAPILKELTNECGELIVILTSILKASKANR
ncbi:MAG: four helix bundle protein [Crocinitomicaceae bacterium]|nr:four helix bundle protein [Crocinitomicaceae bacterium]